MPQINLAIPEGKGKYHAVRAEFHVNFKATDSRHAFTGFFHTIRSYLVEQNFNDLQAKLKKTGAVESELRERINEKATTPVDSVVIAGLAIW